jgi:hypothetical protein
MTSVLVEYKFLRLKNKHQKHKLSRVLQNDKLRYSIQQQMMTPVTLE